MEKNAARFDLASARKRHDRSRLVTALRVVLGERESRSQGEGADVDTKPTKETLTEHEETDTSANLTVGDSEQGS